MQYIKYLKFVLGFLFVFLGLSSCRKSGESEAVLRPERDGAVYCKITSSSPARGVDLLRENTRWHTSDIAQDDIIMFSFFEPFYLKRIELNIPDSLALKGFRLYSDKGIIGDFRGREISIEQEIKFLILKLVETSNFYLTYAYNDENTYKISTHRDNSAAEIDQIVFYDKNDSIIDVFVSRQSSAPSFSYNNSFIGQKIIDYSVSAKSFSLSEIGDIMACSGDTIFFGKIPASKRKKLSENPVNLTELSFSDHSFTSRERPSRIKISETHISLDGVFSLMYDFPDDYFVDVKTLDSTIVHDIRYATDNNFMKQAVYDCAVCMLRYGAAKALAEAQREFLSRGVSIKVFDCYRPHSAQYKLWEVVPNKNYVANPEKGSIHNRGAAVDLTLVDSTGKELDMGTEFDYFGYKAFSTNQDLPDTVLKNRNLLWSVMKKNGFNSIKTEWWHLSHRTCLNYAIADVPLREAKK